MLSFLAENWGTILVCAILIVCVALIIKKLVKDKKKGVSPCGCGGDCSKCHACHNAENTKNNT